MRAAGLELPATSTDGILGVVQVLGAAPTQGGGFHVVGGDSFNFVVEFAEDVRARAVLTYGNATQPGFPQVGHQLAIYGLDRFREVWLERSAIERNAWEHEILD